MTLKEARILFTSLLVQLLSYMANAGVQPALAEGLDRRTMKDPTSDHMKNSLHDIGLAQDIDLYDGEGTYLSQTEDHVLFGTFWKSLHPYCRWGGDFIHADGNHYSLAPPELVGNRA